MRKILLPFMASAILFFPQTSVAKKSDGGRGNFTSGVFLSLNNPPPADAGLNVGVYFGDFLRIEGGIGATEGNGDDLPVVMMSLFTVLFTGGIVPFSDSFRFFKGDSGPSQTVLAYHAGAQLYIPGLALSPTIGAHYSYYEATDGALGLPSSGRHVYYTAGLEWQTPLIFMLGVWYTYAPSLPTREHRVVGVFGSFF